MNIGVIAVQGSVIEHRNVLARTKRDIDIIEVRHPEHMENLDGLILPGGESTTISKLLTNSGLFSLIQKMGKEGLPIMGTCAGCVLLASSLSDPINEKKTSLLGLMEISVSRNAFGRQKESFEAEVKIDGLGDFHGVFIRAPSITKVGGDCKPLARLGGNIVMAEQNNLLALSFHPELTPDPRIHNYFLDKVEENSY